MLCGDMAPVLLFLFVSFRLRGGVWYHIPPSLYNIIFRGVGINASWVVTRFAAMTAARVVGVLLVLMVLSCQVGREYLVVKCKS